MKTNGHVLILLAAVLLSSCFIWGLTSDRFMGYVSTEIPEYTAGRAAFRDRLAYVPCGEYGVKVIDYSDPLRARQRGCLDIGFAVEAVSLYSGRIVVSSDDNPRIIDVSNPDNLTVLFELTSSNDKHVLAGGFCYLYDAADIADGDPLSVLGTYTSGQSGFDGLKVDGGYAYFQSEERVELIDVSIMANPHWRAECLLPAAAHGIEGF